MALRLALGSSRKRILRGLFTEAVLISLAGGALGLPGSVVLLRELSAWQPFPTLADSYPVQPDASVYMVAVLLALVSGLLFGVVPVRQVLRTNPYEVVKAGSNSRAGRRITVRRRAAGGADCHLRGIGHVVDGCGARAGARAARQFRIRSNNTMLAETDLGMAGYSDERAPAMQKRMIEAVGGDSRS